jgi:hypothetical protein
MRLIALKDLSLVADYTDIVSKLQMMMLCMIIYSLSISHGLLHVECLVVSGLSSIRVHPIFQRSTSFTFLCI